MPVPPSDTRSGNPRCPHIPDRGDVVRISFDPQAGHEQAGRRPAIVVSPKAYNARVGLALLCAITSQVKGYPFEVQIPAGYPVNGVILADQVKSLDWQAGRAELWCRLPLPIYDEVLQKPNTLLSERTQR